MGQEHLRSNCRVLAHLHVEVALHRRAVLHGAAPQHGCPAMTHHVQPNDTEMRARALSRWENEGGALATAGTPDSLDETEMRILARLGAAVLDEWSSLSPAVQGNVVRRARTLGAPGDRARVKQSLAHFLRKHGREF